MTVFADVSAMNAQMGDVGAWSEARLVAQAGAQLPAADAYYDYRIWCSRMQLHPHGKMHFFRLLAEAGVARAFGGGPRAFLHLVLRPAVHVPEPEVRRAPTHEQIAELRRRAGLAHYTLTPTQLADLAAADALAQAFAPQADPLDDPL